DASLLGHVPIVGQYYEILAHLGIYKGDFLLNLMRQKLSAKLHKERVTFRDLLIAGETEDRYRFKIHVVASDISRGQMLVLPEDIAPYGIAPEDLEVAMAVRMSMSSTAQGTIQYPAPSVSGPWRGTRRRSGSAAGAMRRARSPAARAAWGPGARR